MTQATWLSTEGGPDLGPQVIFGLDRNGICTLSVGAGLSALGFRAGQLVGQDMFLLFQDDVLGTEAMTRALAGEPFQGEREYQGRRLALYFEPVRDEDGAVTGALGVATDLTEQRTTEREAHTARRRASQLAELSARLTLEALDLPGLLNVAVRAVTESVADIGVLWMRSGHGPELVPAAGWDRKAPDSPITL
ncbi:MAG: PAS domain-containing protein, partial [Mycobacteriaceae bacterium]